MGTESFFLKLLPEGVQPVAVDGKLAFEGRSKLFTTDFRNQVMVSSLDIHPYRNTSDMFVVENTFLLDTSADGRWLKEITIEGCFAWYPEALVIAYQLASTIHTQILPVTVYFPPDTAFYPTDEDTFITTIRQVHDRRWQIFQQHFPGFHKQLLPEQFYKAYQQYRTLPEWWRRWVRAKR